MAMHVQVLTKYLCQLLSQHLHSQNGEVPEIEDMTNIQHTAENIMIESWKYFTLTRWPTWSRPWGTHRHQQRQAKCRPVICSCYLQNWPYFISDWILLIVIINDNNGKCKPGSDDSASCCCPSLVLTSSPAKIDFLYWEKRTLKTLGWGLHTIRVLQGGWNGGSCL